ncbi:amino acid adenylation domain-containing protein, partial [Kitasatospora sp. NPDC001225]
TLECLGRIDGQVKIRGYRIELGEIESALREHTSVRDAVVAAHEDAQGDKSLVAYVVPADDSAPDTAALREFLSRSLPEYMVPAAFMELAAIPLTNSGKVDHKALPAPDADAFAQSAYVAPRTPVEERLAAVWSDVLGVTRVGIEDSFFDLGGDSIRVVRLVGALRATGYDVTVQDVFELRTVARLAQKLSGQEAGASLVTTVEPFALIGDEDRAALPEGVVDAYPLSQVQTGMLVEMMANPGTAVYHNLNSFLIPDTRPFQLETLRAALAHVVQRHDILRTSVEMTGYSQPLQFVHATAELPLSLHDLRELDAAGLDAARAEFAALDRATPFDVTAAPLVRLAVHLESDEAWRLVLSHCHAVTEGWTANSLMTEIVAAYQQLRDRGEATDEEAPAVRYADFIAAELESLASEQDRAFWRDVIGRHAPMLVPAGWGESTGTVERHWAHAPFADLEEDLRRLAARARTSLKSVLLAAHLKVLGSLTSEEAFHTGVVYHGRLEAPGAERVLGMHLNTLPFPATRPSGTWRELVEGVYARESEIWAHRRYPLPAIQRDSGTGERLITMLFDHQDFHQVDTDTVDVDANIGDGVNEFAVNVTAARGRISIGSTTEVLSGRNLARLAEMYRLVLEAMVADFDGDASVACLPGAERASLVGEWNATVEVPVDGCLHEVFAEQAVRTPDAVAVVFGAESLTYAEVDERANRLAQRLVALGAGPDDLVGVSLERGLDLVPTLLGVMKSGAAYLPLDPVNPDERLSYILQDAGARILVTESSLAGRLTGSFEGRVVVLDDEAEQALIAGLPAVAPVTAVTPDNLIYVIYTSGSTGKPKGVALSHANVLRLFTSSERHYHFDAQDVWPLFHSYAFDVSVWEMWGALLHGGRLVVVPATVTRSPDEFLSLLVGTGATILCQTPTAFRSLVAMAADGDPRIDRLNLRAVVFAGERLDLAQLLPWTDRVGAQRPALINMYGITETTVHSTFRQITEEDLAHPADSPVGIPLDDTVIHVLDAAGQLVPVGVPGEIFVGGPAVARGYLDRPELTAERFTPDPFGPAGSRLYRSGDLARRLADGTLESLGRIDGQVKIRGYRIELGEIETALRAHPSVGSAAVIARTSEDGEKVLVAYVVPAEESGSDAADLRAHLRGSLPDYMVPAAYVAVQAIPLTPNGKLDHRALPAPDRSAFAASRHVAPRTPVEERFAEVWGEVLGLEKVSVEDSFFDLGGDSIRAVRLVGALRTAGYDVSIRDVFQARTIAAMAAGLTGQATDGSLVTAVEPFALIGDGDRAALPEGVVDAYPLSQVQTGMLVEMLAAQERGESAYHNINSFRIPDEQAFSPEALREAVAVLSQRHELLRTSVALSGYSQPLQLVHAEAEFAFTVHDWRGLDEQQREERGRAFAERDRAEGFDLAVAPLMRLAVHLESDEAWRLTLSHCHAVTEGWTVNSLLMELLASYRELRDGRELPAYEAPSVRYADFIAAELESLASEQDRAYWRDVVAGHAPAQLPATWADDTGLAAERHWAHTSFADLTEELRELAARTRTSLKSVLLAAHLKVLGSLTSEEAFHTGVVYHGRLEAPGAERVLGMHLNTLPFPAQRASGTWREVVEQVYARESEIWAHRRYPLPAIQHDSGTGERLVTTLFDFQDFHQVDTGTVDTASSLDTGSNEFGLTVIATHERVNLAASTEVLSGWNLARLAEMYRLVLEAMVADFDGDASVACLPGAERASLVGEWNAVVEVPVDGCLHEVFAEQALRTPDAVAVVFGTESLTYAEVDERANRLAQRLVALGAGPDDLVGVSLERGLDLVPTLLGVMKSGAAYLPLDPVNPDERLSYILQDAGARILVTESSLAGRLTGSFEGRVVVLDDEAEQALIAGLPAVAPATAVTPDNLIYVIYTSGSTGKPKGVALSHANVLRLFGATREQFGFGADDVFTHSHSYAFDFSVWEIYGALLHGGRVVVVPSSVIRSPEEFVDLLVGTGATILCQTPTAFRSLVAMAADGDPRIDRLNLRAIVFGGERLDLLEVLPWTRRVGTDRPALINMYGITETTVHSTYHRVGDEDLAHPADSPIGTPLADMTIHLLDAAGQLVPVGVPGEIFVGGPAVARGYLDRPDLTAERFTPDPFGPAGSRLYRSGDLARRLADGTLQSLGRIDGQVKIRGYRIELGEIEATLRRHPLVRDAAVTVHTTALGEKSLVAYLILTEQGADLSDLRAHLRTSLPDYMVPAAYVPLAEIPLTPNGKLDHRALPAPDQASFATVEHVAPRTPVEERLAAIWSDVLGVARVGVEDSFFDLGGDSIRAVRLVGALRTAGYDVSIRDVFQSRTIAAMAAGLTGQGGESLVKAVEPFALIGDGDRAALPEGVVDAYPLSQVQTGILVEMLRADGLGTYHNLTSFRIPDERPFDEPAMLRAVEAVVERHDILRTSMHLSGYSQPLQLVHATAQLPVTVHDWRGLDEQQREERGRAFAERDRAEGFDLAVGPLMRVAVHLESDEAWRLTLSHNHAVTEGWSYHSLLMELLASYQHLRDGRELPAYEAPSVRYADFIAAELESLASEEDRSFWRDVVAGHAPARLPETWADDQGSAEDVHRVYVRYQDLEEDLRRLATRARTSLKSVLLAAHLKVLGSLTSEEAFHTGVVYHGRLEAPGAERVLGMHLNTLPFPATRPSGTWRQLVEQVYAQEAEIWAHRRYPLPAVQRDSGTGERLITMLFEHQDFHQVDTDTVDVDANLTSATNEFALSVVASGGRINIGTSTAVVGRAALERFGAMYRLVLEAMAADPEGDASVVLLPEAERGLLLGEWNAVVEVPVDGCLHEVFAEQAARTPDAVAITFGAESLTYAEVDAWANRLAHHLQGLGAGPDRLVGVCLERGLDLVPTLLGVMKSGAAYLPLDPVNPDERLSYILQDAGARILVSTADLAERVTDSFDGRIVLLDGDSREQIATRPATAPATTVTPDNLIYVIYTSGSTGKPKGVMASHANVLRLFPAIQDDFGFTGGDVGVLSHSYAFDFSTWEMWAVLLNGGRLVVVSNETTRSPEDFVDLLVAEQVTFLSYVPSAFGAVAAMAATGDPRMDRLALRLIAVGGERVEVPQLQPWADRMGLDHPVLLNVYGPTETTVIATAHRLVTEDFDHPSRSLLGHKFHDVRIHLLDADGQLVPVGVVGEMCIGGPGVARGYLDRPELTAEQFIPDPFGPAGSRLYRSGDLARRLADGTLETLGRVDTQVKVRGYRIELGEIESALHKHSGVKSAVVTVHENSAGEKSLVAYVVADGGTAVDAGLLRGHLGGILPDYMIPSAFVALGFIPVNANGKVDHRALPAPGRSAFAASRHVAPRTPVEERFAEVWGEVLGLEKVGVEDSFFDLGGDSIRAVRLVGALRTAGYDVSIRDVFQSRTIAAMAAGLTGQATDGSLVTAVEPFALIGEEDRAALPEGVVDAYPLSQVQTGMLVEMLAAQERGESAYHNINSFRIPDEQAFSPEALREAVAVL